MQGTQENKVDFDLKYKFEVVSKNFYKNYLELINSYNDNHKNFYKIFKPLFNDLFNELKSMKIESLSFNKIKHELLYFNDFADFDTHNEVIDYFQKVQLILQNETLDELEFERWIKFLKNHSSGFDLFNYWFFDFTFCFTENNSSAFSKYYKRKTENWDELLNNVTIPSIEGDAHLPLVLNKVEIVELQTIAEKQLLKKNEDFDQKNLLAFIHMSEYYTKEQNIDIILRIDIS